MLFLLPSSSFFNFSVLLLLSRITVLLEKSQKFRGDKQLARSIILADEHLSNRRYIPWNRKGIIFFTNVISSSVFNSNLNDPTLLCYNSFIISAWDPFSSYCYYCFDGWRNCKNFVAINK